MAPKGRVAFDFRQHNLRNIFGITGNLTGKVKQRIVAGDKQWACPQFGILVPALARLSMFRLAAGGEQQDNEKNHKPCCMPLSEGKESLQYLQRVLFHHENQQRGQQQAADKNEGQLGSDQQADIGL